MPGRIRVVTRAVIQKEGAILLCRVKGDGHYFFPGGGVEFREGAMDTLRRELQEELGAEMKSATFIGAVENRFIERGTQAHEVNLVFSVRIDGMPTASKEGHIDFTWVQVNELDRTNVLPAQLASAVMRWLGDGRIFWAGINGESEDA